MYVVSCEDRREIEMFIFKWTYFEQEQMSKLRRAWRIPAIYTLENHLYCT